METACDIAIVRAGAAELAAAIFAAEGRAFTSIRMFALDGVLQNFPGFGVDADFVFHILSANDE